MAQTLFVPHRRPGPLLPGRLIERPNRFLTRVELASGEVIEAHLPDRGRLEGMVVPGAEIHVVRSEGALRKTAFTLVLVRTTEGVLCCLDPAGANRLVAALIERRMLAGLPAAGVLRQEVTAGPSRFDLCLTPARGGPDLMIEVKSVGAANGRTALFPDAPSLRAARHVTELAARSRRGEPSAIVFVAQRGDVTRIAPHPVDPDFAAALSRAKAAGVRVIGVGFAPTLEGFEYRGRLPVKV